MHGSGRRSRPALLLVCLGLVAPFGCAGAIGDGAGGEPGGVDDAAGASGGGGGGGRTPAMAGAAGASGGGPASGAPAGRAELDFARTRLRRLTRAELGATLELLAPGVTPDAELLRGLPDDASSPFDNDEAVQSPSRQLVEAVNALAEDTAARVLQSPGLRAAVVGCVPAGPADEGCLRQFARRFGRRALRRPMADAEVDRYVAALLPLARQSNDFYVAAGRFMSAMLQDVEFLYRIEAGAPIAGRANARALDDFEIATRLSFLLWGSGPDDSLLDRAQAGQLRSAAGRREAALALLQSRRARTQIDRFHAMWIGYHWSLPQTSSIASGIRTRLRAESDALIERVVFEQKASWLDVLTSEQTFIDDALAQHYGNQALSGSAAPRWTAYSGGERRGLLAHGAFLNVGNKFSDTSPTQRGLVVRERLLCTHVPEPDASLMVNTDQPPPGKCKNDGYRQMLATAGCAGCHKLINAVGFGLERYDLGGKFRTQEPGRADCPISGDGQFASADGDVAFNGPAALGRILARTPELESCLAMQLFRFTQGRDREAQDQPTLDGLTAAFRARGRRFDELLLEIVTAPSFADRTVD